MKITAVKITRVAICTVIIALGAMLSFPTIPPFSLQTLCLFIVSWLLTPLQSVSASLLYLLIGFFGVPVFSSFGAGMGVLLSPSGGFLIAFPIASFFISYLTKKFRSAKSVHAVIFSVATLICYVFGAVWIDVMGYYNGSTGKMLLACIIPFIPFDALKIFLATLAVDKLGSVFKNAKNNSRKG